MESIKKWKEDMLVGTRKKALPILSFPSIQLLNVSVKEIISSSELQSKGMKAIADRCPSAASVSLMDLSVEAECFGAQILFSDDEVPTVTGPIIDPEYDEDKHIELAKALRVPEVGEGRTQIYLDAIEKTLQLIKDRPVLAGVIGPFSLAGRLVDVTSSLMFCISEPEYMHEVLKKCTEFIIKYIMAYKKTGCGGVILAEPLAGILSPALAMEFSGEYCKKIVEAVKDDEFAFIYHNCGNTANVTIDSILHCGADAYHFGDAVDMEEILSKVPKDVVCMGNISPVSEFRQGTPDSIAKKTKDLMSNCCKYQNYVISSGCDIPPMSSWDNIDSFYNAVEEFYNEQ